MAATNVLSQTAVNESTDTLATPYNLPCDSTLTLVAPSGGLVSSSLNTFTLSSDSILSTTFSIGEIPRYRLKSNSTATKTDLIRVVNGTDEVIASHDRRVLGDVIVRPGGEKVKVTKWISTVSKREDAATEVGFDRVLPPMAFVSGEETYLWRVNIQNQMACFAQSAPNTPLAWFIPSQTPLTGSTVKTKASLTLAESVDTSSELLGDILLAWTIFAARCREKAKRSQSNQFQGMQLRPV
jgi:hypothetical protein